MKPDPAHTFDADGQSALSLDHLTAENERLQRENERLKRLLAFRTKAANPNARPPGPRTVH